MASEILEQDWQEGTESVASLQNAVSVGIAGYLVVHAQQNNLGHVFAETQEFAVPGLGSETKKPDVAFVSFERMPELSDENVIPLVPDFAVEVYSRTDSWKATLNKARLYIQRGVKLVWVVDPYSKTVLVYRPDNSQKVFELGEMLEGYDVIKNFKLSVNQVFNYRVKEESLE